MEENETPATYLKLRLSHWWFFVISTVNKSMMICSDTKIISLNSEMMTVGWMHKMPRSTDQNIRLAAKHIFGDYLVHKCWFIILSLFPLYVSVGQ